MKIPLTDKFLWELYEILEKTGEILEPPELLKLRGWREVVPCPELTKLKRKYEKEKRRWGFSKFIDYLKRKGYIKIKNLEGKKGVLLTFQGQQKALKIKYKFGPKFKKRGDKKWIMLIFDIPEKIRQTRDLFRDFLVNLGFQQLQKSVWVCPYDVLKELDKIIRVHSLDKYIRIFLIEEVEISTVKSLH